MAAHRHLKILIIGSNGFIGGGFARAALEAGHEILGVGRHVDPNLSSETYVQTDLSAEKLAPIITRFSPSVVLHAAGSASVEDSFASPLQDLKDLAFTLANTLEGVRISEARPLIIFPSSAAVYGAPDVLPINESAPLNPISPYGFDMVARELIAREYSECFGLHTVTARLFSVFGPRQRRLFIWELYRQLAEADSTVSLRGTGDETRDYLHVDDVSSAFLKLIDVEAALPSRNLVINVASGKEISMWQVAQRLREMIAPGKEIQCRGMSRPGNPLHWCADVSLVHSMAPGWQPAPFEEKLRECTDEWRRESG